MTLLRHTVLPILLLESTGLAAAPPGQDTLRHIADRYVETHSGGEGKSSRSDFSAAGFEAEISEKERQLGRLRTIDPVELEFEEDIDRRLLIGILRSDIHTARVQRRWENDPELYLPGARLGMLLGAVVDGVGDKEQLADLLASLPDIASRDRRLRPIPGVVPSPVHWPAACRFADRCGEAFERCRTEPPPLEPLADRGEDRASRCWLAVESPEGSK